MGPRRCARVSLLGAVVLAIAACGVAPSPEPATPAAPPTMNAGLVELSARVRAAAAPRGAFVRALAAASAEEDGRLDQPARTMLAWIDAERRWLDAHGPDPCYAEAYGAYLGGLETLADASERFLVLAARSAAPSEAEGQAAGETLARAIEQLDEAEALATAARSTCG